MPTETDETSLDEDAATSAETSADASSEPTAEPTAEPKAAERRPTKAERLEARAARLREAEERAAARAETGGASRRWVVVSAVAAFVAVAAIVAAVALTVRLGAKNDELTAATRTESTRESALAAAQAYAVDFGSYDYARIEQDFAKVTSHLTPSFAKDYASISAGLRDAIVKYKGKSTATVQAAAVSSVKGDTAFVLVFLDQSVTNTDVTTPRIDRNRMQLTLQRQGDGSWLISNLELK